MVNGVHSQPYQDLKKENKMFSTVIVNNYNEKTKEFREKKIERNVVAITTHKNKRFPTVKHKASAYFLGSWIDIYEDGQDWVTLNVLKRRQKTRDDKNGSPQANP